MNSLAHAREQNDMADDGDIRSEWQPFAIPETPPLDIDPALTKEQNESQKWLMHKLHTTQHMQTVILQHMVVMSQRMVELDVHRKKMDQWKRDLHVRYGVLYSIGIIIAPVLLWLVKLLFEFLHGK